MRVHDLRWTFVTLCSSLGIKQNVIRKMTGHTTDYMTAAYTKVFKEDMSKEMEKLNASAYEVHAMCIDDEKPETQATVIHETYAHYEVSFGVKVLQEWLGQQDYEFYDSDNPGLFQENGLENVLCSVASSSSKRFHFAVRSAP